MDISFIIVNFRSRQFLKRCINSIVSKMADFPFEIIVVNNDREILDGMPALPSLKIIEHNENNGFARAANIGAEKSQGEFLFFLNSDTEIVTANMQELKNFFNDHSLGAAAPRLISPDGSFQEWSCGNEITFFETLLNNLGYIRSKPFWSSEKTQEVDWISGAAFLIRKDVFNKIGKFDENFFMYFEDVDISRRVRKAGKKIKIIPHFKVLHLGGKSRSGTKEQKSQYYKSQDYYFKKHFGVIQSFAIKSLRNLALFFSINKY
jgi:N-acetylglucosaminyl-diphospho-decaprenol L-rhamnosyltransferase